MLIHELQNHPEANDTMVTLTDDEVRDACLLRGLPVDLAIEDMRSCLINHIRMVRPVHEAIFAESQAAGTTPTAQQLEGLGLMTLHLPVLRDYWRRKLS